MSKKTVSPIVVTSHTHVNTRSNSTDNIVCWFISTDYSEEIFIVRHAYFTGAAKPYEKLKHTIKTESDESAWSALYSTTSYP